MVCLLFVSTGAASLICAEILRQENYGGRIIMASRDELLPYDKTRLSKVLKWSTWHDTDINMLLPMNIECIYLCIFLQVMNVESDTIVLRRMEFFHRYDIEVWLRKEVSGFLLTSSVLLCKYHVLLPNACHV